ncbi:MAG: hypothetical protein ISQ95_03030 [Flavobacteriales bacterium]|nr:hypothetical protein [Flavobacteriales bacterium]
MKNFSYMGFSANFSFSRLLLSLSIFLFTLFLISYVKINDFIYFIGIIYFVLAIIPSSITYSNQLISVSILFSHYFIFYSIFIIGNYIRLPMKLFSIKENNKLLLVVFFSLLLIIPFFIKFLPYVNLKNLLLQDIYETRAIQRKINTPYYGYTYSVLNKVLIPILIVYSLVYKKYKTLLIGVFSLIFLFLCGAHKSVLLGSILLLLFYFGNVVNKLKFFLSLTIIIIVSFSVFYTIDNESLLPLSIVARRVFFVPSLLDSFYFDFFEQTPLYWSGSIGRNFIDYVYDKPVPYIIGEVYFNSTETAANNGIVSDGFSNAGFLGVIINGLFLGLYISVIKSLNISHKFYGLYFLLLISIISSSLPVVLLTHSGIALLISALIFQKNTTKFDSL